LSFDNNFEKSLTVNNFTVLSAIVISSVDSAASSSEVNDAFIFSPSSGFTSLTKYVLKNPTITAIKDVTTNTPIIVTIIFPILLGLCILAIDVVTFKNISGTTTTNNRLTNTSPNGCKTVAFSWNIIPTSDPTIIATKRIIVDL